MRAALDTIILPLVQRFAPEVLVVQCGADGLSEDPLSRLALSNRAHREVVGALRRLCPRLIVLGGGGYNPWSVARCWTGIWGLLSGREVPDDLPPDAREILAALTWSRLRGRTRAEKSPFASLDTPRWSSSTEPPRVHASRRPSSMAATWAIINTSSSEAMPIMV